MNGEIYKAILHSGELSNISGLIILYFIVLMLNFVLMCCSKGLKKAISSIKKIKKRELLNIIFLTIKTASFIILLIICILLLLPGTVSIAKNKLNIIIIISAIINIMAFIFSLVFDTEIKKNNNIVSFLLFISIILVCIANASL